MRGGQPSPLPAHPPSRLPPLPPSLQYNATLLNLVKDASSPAAVASTAQLNSLLGAGALADSGFPLTARAMTAQAVWSASADDINDQTYCGYQAVSSMLLF